MLSNLASHGRFSDSTNRCAGKAAHSNHFIPNVGPTTRDLFEFSQNPEAWAGGCVGYIAVNFLNILTPLGFNTVGE